MRSTRFSGPTLTSATRVHLQWLEWLGFQTLKRIPEWGAAKVPFRQVIKIRGLNHRMCVALISVVAAVASSLVGYAGQMANYKAQKQYYEENSKAAQVAATNRYASIQNRMLQEPRRLSSEAGERLPRGIEGPKYRKSGSRRCRRLRALRRCSLYRTSAPKRVATRHLLPPATR